jgi:ATP-dependent Clp protease protease subunit
MSLRTNLPAAELAARPQLRSGPAPQALDRWNPGVRAAAEGEADNVVSILDVIGEDWWTGGGITAKRVAGALRAIGRRDVVVHVNSPGGDYFEGLAIYNLLREHPARVTVRVLGLAASAASVIAMAGDEVEIARAGFLMIHNTWVVAVGDRHGLREAADWLAPFDATAADIYAARSGLETAEIAKMMDRETWIGGTDAVARGFADALLPSDSVAADAASAAAATGPAAHRLDTLLAKLDVPRSERRELIRQLKGGTPGAAPTGTPGAAVTAGIAEILAGLRTL